MAWEEERYSEGVFPECGAVVADDDCQVEYEGGEGLYREYC